MPDQNPLNLPQDAEILSIEGDLEQFLPELIKVFLHQKRRVLMCGQALSLQHPQLWNAPHDVLPSIKDLLKPEVFDIIVVDAVPMIPPEWIRNLRPPQTGLVVLGNPLTETIPLCPATRATLHRASWRIRAHPQENGFMLRLWQRQHIAQGWQIHQLTTKEPVALSREGPALFPELRPIRPADTPHVGKAPSNAR